MSAVEDMESVPSVCVPVNALTAEPFGIQSKNLVEALTLIISWMSTKVKVIGQSRQVIKNMNFEVSDGFGFVQSLCHDKDTS